MLSYKKVTAKSLGGLKDNRTFLTALFIAIPMFIYSIISLIILNNLNTAVTNIVNEFFLLLQDPNAVITNTTINGILSDIVMVYADNISSVIMDVAISLVASFITLLATYITYYVAYKIINKQETDVKTMFSQLWGGICLTVLYSLKILAWGLLFIVPGIIKAYSYSLCFLIKVENPNMKAIDCIKKSKEMMKGRKERLFIQYLIFLLINFILSFIITNVTSIFGLFIGIGNYISSIIYVYANTLISLVWAYMVTVYYEGVKEDEQYLALHPELKERGITGVIKDEKPRIRIEYGPNIRVEDPFKTDAEKTQEIFKDPYNNNPFKKNGETKNDDPFED